jgi:hypothetical protein
MRFVRPVLPILAGLALLAPDAAAQQLSDRFHDAEAAVPAATVGPNVAATAAQPAPAVQPAAAQAERDGFETTAFAQFIASPAGRILRGVVGAGMIAGGVALGETGGTVLAVAGAVPLSAGVFDLCYVSALLGGPIRGEEIREAGSSR